MSSATIPHGDAEMERTAMFDKEAIMWRAQRGRYILRPQYSKSGVVQEGCETAGGAVFLSRVSLAELFDGFWRLEA